MDVCTSRSPVGKAAAPGPRREPCSSATVASASSCGQASESAIWERNFGLLGAPREVTTTRSQWRKSSENSRLTQHFVILKYLPLCLWWKICGKQPQGRPAKRRASENSVAVACGAPRRQGGELADPSPRKATCEGLRAVCTRQRAAAALPLARQRGMHLEHADERQDSRSRGPLAPQSCALPPKQVRVGAVCAR